MSVPYPTALQREGGIPPLRLSETLVAVHGQAPAQLLREARWRISEALIVVPKAALQVVADPDGCCYGPVYASGEDTAPFVPTGRIFVRFRNGQDAAGQGTALAEAGFRIEAVPGYAPDAAWLQPREGGIPESLAGLPRLRALENVAHVEPELLAPAVRR